MDIVEVAKKLFIYDPEAGDLIYKVRTPDMYDDLQMRRLNTRFAGKKVKNVSFCGAGKAKRPYIRVNFSGRSVYGHRLAWMIYYGYEPKEVDHINGDTLDNRIFNLREVTHEKNGQNQKIHSTNTSGRPGVYFRMASTKITENQETDHDTSTNVPRGR